MLTPREQTQVDIPRKIKVIIKIYQTQHYVLQLAAHLTITLHMSGKDHNT